ncbi:MAG: nucleotidyltransferase family protein [Nitrospinae bacterium]|nr:nucleotidyltransferase family protein [Nitrospinota bacterium]
MADRLNDIKTKILPVLRNHRIKRAGLFGSCARGEITDKSDVDVLVEIEDEISLFDFIDIKLELEEALGRKVDLVEYGAIKPTLRERILKEEVALL